MRRTGRDINRRLESLTSPLTAFIRSFSQLPSDIYRNVVKRTGDGPHQARPRSGFSGVTIERDGKGIHRSRTHRHDKMQRKSILGLERTHRANLLWSAGTRMFSPHHAILISPIHSLGIAVPTVSPPTQPGSWMMRY